MVQTRLSRTEKDFSNLPLSDDFMFSEVMRQKKICKLFLEELLQKPIARVEYVSKQVDFSDSKSWHGVRLDVYIRDAANTRYDIEMQTTDSDSLERRIRYYQSSIDRQALSKGKQYKELPESFVIFVCNFDYYGAGLPVYERMSCIQGHEDIHYEDGTHAIILNSRYSDPGNTPEAIIEFLHCVRTNDLSYDYQSKLMHAICPAIEEIRNDEAKEVFFLTYQAKLEERHKKGRIEGKEEMVVNMIRDGYLMSAITKLSQFTEDHVRRLAEENNLTIAIG